MANPFHYGTPAEGDHFTGRRSELDALVSRMADGINVVLLSPRRYGKTSLHRAAQGRLARRRPAPAIVEVNLLRCASRASLAGRLTAAAYRVPGARWHRTKQAVPEYLRRLRISPQVSFDASGHPRFGFDPGLNGPDAEAVLADVYTLLADEAERRPAVLVLDEFQAVTRHDPGIPDLLKGLADEHPAVSLVLAGSKRHIMEELVVHREAPLYGMAQRIALGPLPEAEMLRYLQERASRRGKPFSEGLAQVIVDRAGPVPNDIQHLGYEAWEAAGGRIDQAAVDLGLARAVAHEATLFAESLARLSPGQGRVLVALAAGPPDEPYGAAFARAVGLASGSSVRKALQPLIANEEVVERDGKLAVADPFFAEWLRADEPRGPSWR